MSFLDRALADGHARLTGDGKNQKIVCVAADWTERYSDPEEKVRGEFWAEVIYRYGSEGHRIGIEIVVANRTRHSSFLGNGAV